ncbi:uncharacterized protein MYCGRDRAFT_72401 [Zymoseptoria tritici IPO323]|uniref:NACHT domain-containing protein n=1 Tax=Zymoseptoria tritici (strain CBS 115943 / IPO323) TaxID=336722 RepID=F9XBG6_ZYMTI|nr:uncharacterized protein MYCGRDRAFT_72401 [Zymoseptoria tritici IPO323]EGP87506.1 hypothetical protein MYCGRDRAFT_72401 [Zymoseptoria tritici IPO323]
MAPCEDYTLGWICALPVEVAAAKAILDHVHDRRIPGHGPEDDTHYILGDIHGHNVVVAYPNGRTSEAKVATQLHACFMALRFVLIVGVAGGVPNTKEDIRLGDVVVSKSMAGLPAVIRYDAAGVHLKYTSVRNGVLDQPSPLLLIAMGKAETAAILDESRMNQYIAETVLTDPSHFRCPAPEHDVISDSMYDHPDIDHEEGIRGPDGIQSRQSGNVQGPRVHYGTIASGETPMRDETIRDKIAQENTILCFEAMSSRPRDAGRYLVVRGICDYADSHTSEAWQRYAAVAAAAYAKEVVSFIPTVSNAPLATRVYAEAAPVLDALLLTRPEVDRKSLVALKGRRVDGTCEWLVRHVRYQEWLRDAKLQVLWICGGPGKGKTMLSIYITSVLQPLADATDAVLLYYFCSNRDKNRNSAVTIMRGLLHQWIDLHPHLAKEIKGSFEGTETTKYTTSNFVPLWRAFVTLLRQSRSRVICVLDGLDECARDSLGQFLDAIVNYISTPEEKQSPSLKLIILSRPQPALLQSRLGHFQRISLDASDTIISQDIERYVSAKVAELAVEQHLSDESVRRVQQTLLSGADGTFLWVGFAVNELRGQNWSKIDDVLRDLPKGLSGIYQRLLQQISNKEVLVPILQWIVLAARPLTLDELTMATSTEAVGTLSAKQVLVNRLRLSGLLVKIEGDVINLVHESAKEFFQGDQVKNIEGISMFHMNEHTHERLMQTCLAHIERSFGNLGGPQEMWQNKDNYGRTPLSWAVDQGHREMAELLLDRGARVNSKDRSMLTALHIAVTGQHGPVVSVLLEHGAYLEAKGEHGDTDTPLMRAILANSTEITQKLLEHGARVDKLPSLLGIAPLLKPTDCVDQRVEELLGLQEKVFDARFKRSTRFVNMVMKGLGLSLRLPLVLGLMSLYLKFVALDRWDGLSVLQELVQENKTDELREWAKLYHMFFLGLIAARNPKRLYSMGELSTQILQKVAPRDLHALLAITVFTGMETELATVQYKWSEGTAITAAAISGWANISCERDALEFFHFGVREFLNDFDDCVRARRRKEAVLRTASLLTVHFAMIADRKAGPIKYFSRVVAEFFEGYIGSDYETDLFSDANQACVHELSNISANHDSARLHLLMTSIFQFAQQAQGKGQDRFLDVPSASCLVLCQENVKAHDWLVGEAIPYELGAMIAEESPGPLQNRACKSLAQCLIIGKQHGIVSSSGAKRERVEKRLHSLPEVKRMIARILGPRTVEGVAYH